MIGFLTGIIGLGGGYALVPSYLYLFKAPMRLAIGTSMASFIWMALVGAGFKLYEQVVNIPVAVTLGIGAAIGAVYGARLVAKFKPATLKTFFGALFLYVSLKYILIFFGIFI
ncbi:MAG: TSUP family transporter [Peptococcaceae bacterium]|nr:TSUP family transporter [Peptococcaceae bacterium]MDH7524903.1 TSUP family transporter [Peptococcaceae bacterium]